VIAVDVGILRGIGTLVLFLSFVAYCAWAWSPAQRRRFDEASRLPFLDGDDLAAVRGDADRAATAGRSVS
jgi:cytochrome c oxidase cbb3-type subunit IV